MVDEEPIMRQILEETANATDDSYPIVLSDIALLFIAIGWILVCLAIFCGGKHCIQKQAYKAEYQDVLQVRTG